MEWGFLTLRGLVTLTRRGVVIGPLIIYVVVGWLLKGTEGQKVKCKSKS